MRYLTRRLIVSLIFLSLIPYLSRTFAKPVILILPGEDLFEVSSSQDSSSSSDDIDSSDWDDDFGDSKSGHDLDPGSWSPIFESDFGDNSSSGHLADYYSSVEKMITAIGDGEVRVLQEAVSGIEAAAAEGNPHEQSVLGFLNGLGMMKAKNKAKGFLYHSFAAEGGNLQSKMALAYTYSRQNMPEQAVNLYAELAEVAVSSFMNSKDSPVIEPIRIHYGVEENKDALRKFRGEEDDDFQILEYQAQKGNALAMHKVGLFYYFGLRGLRRDHAKALSWFTKAVKRGEPRSMELLGEIYARGSGVERNYTRALAWFTLALKQEFYSAYNGMGYLYIKGYGVEKNHTKAKEYFERAAGHDDAGGHYNLGVMYLKGIGIRKDVKIACQCFLVAAKAGQPKAFYQLAKMFHTGVGLKKNIPVATTLYKLVVERGPWSSLSRWALESYLKGDVGKALFLYLRMAELGYEVAQSNAAWILDKFGEDSMCFGEFGICTDFERHQLAHSLWWQASEQGNEHAALLIGDAYYYGRGMERDYKRAAEAYMHARSQLNAQAMFNLGYMHEHGLGLPLDLHLAKRYYDQALESDPAAKLPVTLALTSLWIRRNYADTFLVHFIDSLPEFFPKVQTWVEDVIFEEGNATILTLFACLLTVLYLRERQRRHVVADGEAGMPRQPN